MSVSKQDVGKLLSELRKKSGLSQASCAKALGVSDKAISKWETGSSYPSFDALERFASLVGLSLFEFFRMLERPEKPYYCLAITGGPCAGKSAALELISEMLSQRGWTVLKMREIATNLIQGGYLAQTQVSAYDLQKHIFSVQRAFEDALFERAANCAKASIAKNAADRNLIARAHGSKTVVLCDRGLADGDAYLAGADYTRLLHVSHMSAQEVFDRYDGVLVLESAAVSTQDYTVENNPARKESAAEARMLDSRIRRAWSYHPNMRFIDSKDSFEEKLLATVQEAFSLLGEPLPSALQPERRYLVKRPTEQALAARIPVVEERETFVFLEPRHATRYALVARERKGAISYAIARSGQKASDPLGIETPLSADEHRALSDFADPALKPVKRDVMRFQHNGILFSVSFYEYFPYVAVVEATGEIKKGKEDPISLPPFLNLVRELSDSDAFSLRSIARDLAQGRL